MRRWWMILVLAMCLPIVPESAFGSSGYLVSKASTENRQKSKRKKAEGDRLRKKGKHKQAEAAYRQAAKLDPSWHEPYEALGNMLFSKKKYIKAIKYFEKAVKIEPAYVTGFYNIAFAYRKARKYKKAAEYYRQYIKRKSEDPDAYYGLAATYEALGNAKKAMKYYLLYAQKETRPAEREYVVKAKNKAEKLRKSLGLEDPEEKKPPAPAPVATTQTEPKPAPKPVEPKPAPTATTSQAPVAATKPAPHATSSSPAGRPGVTADSPSGDSRVLALLKQGDQAMAKNSYTRAMKAYFDAVQLSPDNADALYKLGRVYWATNNKKAAMVKWRNALTVNPKHAGAKQALADGSASSVAAAPVEKPVPAPAPKPVTAPEPPPAARPSPTGSESQPVAAKPVASATSPRDRSTKLVADGDAHFKKKSFSRAISLYTKATQVDPKNEEAMFKLGVAYAMSGNYKVAIYKWDRVLEINPNNKSARKNVDLARAKLGSKAPPVKTRVASAKPEKPTPPANDFEALMARARQMKKQKNAKGVLDNVNKALKIKQDAQALLLRGEALVILKRYADAKRAFSKAMVMNPNLASPFYGLGEACRLSGDKDRAHYYFRMYIRSRSVDVSPQLVNKAKAYLKR